MTDRKLAVEEFCTKDLITELSAHSPSLGEWAKKFIEEHDNDFNSLTNTLFHASRMAKVVSDQYDSLMDTRNRS